MTNTSNTSNTDSLNSIYAEGITPYLSTNTSNTSLTLSILSILLIFMTDTPTDPPKRKRGKSIAGKKRGAKKDLPPPPAKKKAAKKKAKKKLKLTDAERARRRLQMLKLKQSQDPALMRKAEREKHLAELSLKEQISKKEASIAKNDLAARGAEVMAALKEHDYSPLNEMIMAAKSGDLKPNEKLSIDKYLADKLYPSLKAIDMQADMNMNVSVTVQSFADATINDMKKVHNQVIDLKDEDYEEFEDDSTDV